MTTLSSEEIAAINAEHATIIKKLCQDEIDRHARELLSEDAAVQEAQPAQISNLPLSPDARARSFRLPK